MFAVVLTLGGVALAYQFATTPIQESMHAKIGYGIVLASLLQTVMGIMRPSKEASNRAMFVWAHRIIGMATFGAAGYQIYEAFGDPVYGEILRDYLGTLELEQIQQGVMLWSG